MVHAQRNAYKCCLGLTPSTFISSSHSVGRVFCSEDIQRVLSGSVISLQKQADSLKKAGKAPVLGTRSLREGSTLLPTTKVDEFEPLTQSGTVFVILI